MAITLVQQNSTTSSAASMTMEYGSNNSAGNLLTLLLTSGSSGAGSTVTDSAGNSWVRFFTSTNSGGAQFQAWHALSAVGSSNTITVEWGNGAAKQYAAQEWSGGGTWTLASTSLSTGTSSLATPGSISPDPSTVVFLLAYNNNGNFSIGVQPSGYTELNSTSFARGRYWYKAISGSTSSENPTVQTDATENWITAIGAFASTNSGAAAVSVVKRLRLTLGVGA